jgi:murein L,D-transpeptidase YafK
MTWTRIFSRKRLLVAAALIALCGVAAFVGSKYLLGRRRVVQRSMPAGAVEIVADKSDGKVYVYVNGALENTYDAIFGPVEGDKEVEGDKKTPEGEFYVCAVNPDSSFYLSLGLSYPNREDAERGLRDGIITKDQYDRVVRAIDGGKCPPWDTPLGGEVFIHGYSGGRTRGCIALSNKDMADLYEIANVRTRVIIRQ